jgi:hypothetical protein
MESKRITVEFPLPVWKYFTDMAEQEKRSFQKQLIWYLENSLRKELVIVKDILRKRR